MSSSELDPEPPIRLNLPPLSPSLFDAEPSDLQQPNGSAARHSSDPSSPTSSGYAGERGSSTATTVSLVEEVLNNEIQEITIQDAQPLSHSSWLPGKRHGDEVYKRFSINSFSLRLSVLHSLTLIYNYN